MAERIGSPRDAASTLFNLPGYLVIAVDDPEDAAGVQVDDRRHPRLLPAPLAGGQPKVAVSAEAVLIDPDAAHHHRVDVAGQCRGGGEGPLHEPPRHRERRGDTSLAARPEVVTAATRASRSRPVERA